MERTKKLIPEKVIGFKSTKNYDYKIEPTNTIIYALSIGFNENPLNKKDFKFTYELSDDFSVFPTYAAVIPLDKSAEFLSACPGIPDFNFMSLLHGEEWVEFVKPIPINENLQYQMEIADLEDKGKGTVISIQSK